VLRYYTIAQSLFLLKLVTPSNVAIANIYSQFITPRAPGMERLPGGTPSKAIDMFAVICGAALVAQHQRNLLVFVATQWSSTSAR
jgi:hypothetical protein